MFYHTEYKVSSNLIFDNTCPIQDSTIIRVLCLCVHLVILACAFESSNFVSCSLWRPRRSSDGEKDSSWRRSSMDFTVISRFPGWDQRTRCLGVFSRESERWAMQASFPLGCRRKFKQIENKKTAKFANCLKDLHSKLAFLLAAIKKITISPKQCKQKYE